MGWLEVEPGRETTFSVYLKAAQEDTTAVLAVRQFEGRSFEKSVRVGLDWRRYSMTFKPTSRWCYVLAGPDLRKTERNPKPSVRAVLWLDACPLEKGKGVTKNVPRGTLAQNTELQFVLRGTWELGVETDKIGNVFRWDEPSIVPLGHSGFNQPLRDEKQQAAYAVRWNVMMLANGVDKIFYHAGTCAGINQDSLQGVFYEYAGEPHKIYAAQAVMSHLFTPSCRFVKKLLLGKNIKVYLFQDDSRLIEGKHDIERHAHASVGMAPTTQKFSADRVGQGPTLRRLIALVWAMRGEKGKTIRIANEKIKLWDIMGRERKTKEFVPNGTPVYLIGEEMAVEGFEGGIESTSKK